MLLSTRFGKQNISYSSISLPNVYVVMLLVKISFKTVYFTEVITERTAGTFIALTEKM